MRLIVAAEPQWRSGIQGKVPIAHAAYQVREGFLCSLPLAPSLCGGGLLITGWDGAPPVHAAEGVLRECRRRRYNTVILPFPARTLAAELDRAARRGGLSLWVHESDGDALPECRVLVSTALSGGDLRTRLEACCRRFGGERIVLELQRLRMEFPLPCPTGQGKALSPEELRRLQGDNAVYYSRELGSRYFTCRRGQETRFVLLDDGDTLRRKIALGEELGIPRGLVAAAECGDVLAEILEEKNGA